MAQIDTVYYREHLDKSSKGLKPSKVATCHEGFAILLCCSATELHHCILVSGGVVANTEIRQWKRIRIYQERSALKDRFIQSINLHQYILNLISLQCIVSRYQKKGKQPANVLYHLSRPLGKKIMLFGTSHELCTVVCQS